MQTSSEELASLFRIEEVVLPAASAPKIESGCDLCQHCFLLRNSLLRRSNNNGAQIDTCIKIKESTPCNNR